MASAPLFDRLEVRQNLPTAPAGIAVATVVTAVGPARNALIEATFAAHRNDTLSDLPLGPLPQSANFFIRINGVIQPDGSQITMHARPAIDPESLAPGESGALQIFVPLAAGAAIIELVGRAETVNVYVDPVGRPTKDHAALVVHEFLAP